MSVCVCACASVHAGLTCVCTRFVHVCTYMSVYVHVCIYQVLVYCVTPSLSLPPLLPEMVE